jgi:integrase
VSASALLPGVRPHGQRFQVRVHPFDAETFATPAEANMRAIELRALRDAGVRTLEAPSRAGGWLTLEQACDALLARKRVTGKRRPLTPKGIRHWEDSLRVWRTGRFASLPLRVLRREQLEDALLERAAKHPTAARNEAQGLKAVLVYAQSRGETFQPNLLTIEAPALRRKPRRSLSLEELEWLAASTDERQRRLILFAGTVGNRISELFTLTDDRVDVAGRSILVPAELCKERREKVIDLTAEETALLAEQLDVRVPSAAALVFPTSVLGRRWRYSAFREDVWLKALDLADVTWRREHGVDESPFPGLTLHVLRHTAISLMREAGMPAEYVAQRVGHADGGALLLKNYRHTRRAEVRRALDELGHGLRASLAADAADVVELDQHRRPPVGDPAVTGSALRSGDPVQAAAGDAGGAPA